MSHPLLCLIFITVAAVWQRMNVEVRIVLIRMTFTLIALGPIGIGYIYFTEVFPRAYRTWCLLIVNVVVAWGLSHGLRQQNKCSLWAIDTKVSMGLRSRRAFHRLL